MSNPDVCIGEFIIRGSRQHNTPVILIKGAPFIDTTNDGVMKFKLEEKKHFEWESRDSVLVTSFEGITNKIDPKNEQIETIKEAIDYLIENPKEAIKIFNVELKCHKLTECNLCPPDRASTSSVDEEEVGLNLQPPPLVPKSQRTAGEEEEGSPSPPPLVPKHPTRSSSSPPPPPPPPRRGCGNTNFN